MLKLVSALFAGLIAGWGLVGSTTTASAHYRHHGCCGGYIAPSYVYKNVNKYIHKTRYHDTWRVRYVHRVHKIVHVTRIRPIIHITSVLRVHHRTVARVHNVNVWRTQWLPARKYVTHKVKNYYDCNCSRY
jgi:hypothetical protein